MPKYKGIFAVQSGWRFVPARNFTAPLGIVGDCWHILRGQPTQRGGRLSLAEPALFATKRSMGRKAEPPVTDTATRLTHVKQRGGKKAARGEPSGIHCDA